MQATASASEMPAPSEPPRSLRLPVDGGLFLDLAMAPDGDYIWAGLYRRSIKRGNSPMTLGKRLCFCWMPRDVIELRVRVSVRDLPLEETALWLGGTCLTLRDEGQAQAVADWLAAHGLTIKQQRGS